MRLALPVAVIGVTVRTSPASPATSAAFALVLLAALSGACGRSPSAPPGALRRIVSLVPAATEALFAIGAGDLVVARSKWCDYPPEAAALPAAGDALSVSPEKVRALRPDLVIAAGEGQREALAPLAGSVRIEVVMPETAIEVCAAVRRLGALTGRAGAAEDLAGKIEGALLSAKGRAAGRAARRVLFVVQREPLVVAGARSCVADLLAAMGAVNVAADLSRPWPEMSLESVVARDPEVIVDAAVNDPRDPREFWGRFATLAAVRDGRVVRFADPSLLRPGPRLPLLLAAIEDAVYGGGR